MKRHLVILVAFSLMAAIAGCLTITLVQQPSTVFAGDDFQITVTVVTDDDSFASGNPRFGAILLPVGFVVNSAVVEGSITLTENPAFEALLTTDFPPDPGYYWWVGSVVDETPGTLEAVVDVTAGNTQGAFDLSYRVGFNDGTMHYDDSLRDQPLEVLAQDSDGDGMPDWWESIHGCLMANTADGKPDFDSDGLANGEEYSYSDLLDPCDPDTDNDGMDDGWEVTYAGCGLDPLVGDSLADSDGDGLANFAEYSLGADPCDPDTDGDGLTDGDEVNTHGTDPLDTDSDGDLMDDGWEVQEGATCGLDPLTGDSLSDHDGDLLANLAEYNTGTGPCIPDSDGDGSIDGVDCDPVYDRTYPGAGEICDGVDN